MDKLLFANRYRPQLEDKRTPRNCIPYVNRPIKPSFSRRAVPWPTSDRSAVVFRWSFGPRAREIAHFNRTVGVTKCRRDSFANLRGMSVTRCESREQSEHGTVLPRIRQTMCLFSATNASSVPTAAARASWHAHCVQAVTHRLSDHPFARGKPRLSLP